MHYFSLSTFGTLSNMSRLHFEQNCAQFERQLSFKASDRQCKQILQPYNFSLKFIRKLSQT